MKTVIVTMALSLVCAVSLAKSLDSTVGSRLPTYIDGSAYEPASNGLASHDSAATLARNRDSTVGSRLPSTIDGSAYQQSTNMIVNQKSRAEAASFDRLRAGLSDLFGRN
jgi:hypothetical protein